MRYSSIESDRKILFFVTLSILALLCGTSLILATPVHAQEPGETGYLFVQVIDWLTGRPLENRVVTVYNRSGDQIDQVTTACQEYVEFTNLSRGWHRVILEPDAGWTTVRRNHMPTGGDASGEWIWVPRDGRTGVQFYELPDVTGAGLRIEAYHGRSRRADAPREPLEGAAFTVFDANGNFVANGTSACNGLLDFTGLSSGRYRIVDANDVEDVYQYPGEQWVTLRFGALARTWFFTAPSLGPQTTPTPVP